MKLSDVETDGRKSASKQKADMMADAAEAPLPSKAKRKKTLWTTRAMLHDPTPNEVVRQHQQKQPCAPVINSALRI